MKKHHRMHLAFVCILVVCIVSPLKNHANSLQFTLAPQLVHIHYKESIMEEKGYLSGVYAQFSGVTRNNNMYYEAGLSYLEGSVDYDGSIQFYDFREPEPLSTKTDNQITTVRGRIGRIYPATALDWIPYAGLASRTLTDDLPGEYGYRREQTYTYIPLGIEIRKETSSGAFWNTSLEFDYLLHAENKSLGMTFEQDSGYGVRATIQLLRPLKHDLHVFLQGYVQYWDIEQSASVYQYLNGFQLEFYEPENTSTLIGLIAGLQF